MVEACQLAQDKTRGFALTARICREVCVRREHRGKITAAALAS
jgi:hypothetical protein